MNEDHSESIYLEGMRIVIAKPGHAPLSDNQILQVPAVDVEATQVKHRFTITQNDSPLYADVPADISKITGRGIVAW